MNERSIPETVEWLRRIGYKVCQLPIHAFVNDRSLRANHGPFMLTSHRISTD